MGGPLDKSNPVYHFGQTIAVLNKRLANCKNEDISGASIIAVACLAHAEVRIVPTGCFAAEVHHKLTDTAFEWIASKAQSPS